MNIVFGPIVSRRFGVSLGVDLSPNVKQCNFDCVYCELKGAKSIEKFYEIVPLEVLLKSVKEALRIHKNIDVLTITANGEPTMYPYLKEFIENIKPHIPSHIKTLILSNGSLFGKTKVQEALKHFDIVKFSLDSLDAKSYQKIDRIHKNLTLDSIIDGIKSYASVRKNMLVCEILLVKGFNDNANSMRPLAEFLREIRVDRVDLGTIDRPPAYKVEAIDRKKIEELSAFFWDIFVSFPQRKPNEIKNLLSLGEDEILDLLKRRPLEIKESESLFTKETFEKIDSLLKVNKIQIKQVGLIDFYTL